ncbi:phage antirepressor [Anaerococcus sp.]|uniref:phage antirepressor n=1 Tax=Anaerococcus sp. TaxID=1872515 RepID=UPI0029053EAF|nr:phage antirepressor KilAC domain-containing protein [Anaerococcus sp.]MDU3212137.1 phage antirepressor KilAC domain-containing protein [Anaerococcus sp.]
MKDLKIFENNEFGKIRATLDENGEPWFVASDVCKSLEIKNTTDALKRLDEDEKSRFNLGLSGGATNVVNEYGLYNLVLASRKKETKPFRRWITHEVIPAIRKDGGYMLVDKNNSEEEIMAKAVLIAQKSMERLKLENKQKDQIIGELKPKADYVDKILQNKSLIKVSAIAKDYGMSAQEMNKLLHELRIQYNQGGQWLLYAKIQDKGYTSSETHSYQKKDGTTDVRLLTKWTQKGRIFLYDELKKNGYLPMIER